MSRFETADGLSLYFEEHGTPDGTPLICLPGLTRDGQDFRYALPHLAAYRVILLDLRGRGRSDYADDPATYNVLSEAGDVVALMDHLSLPRAAILGTSRGGLVAMALAATARDRLLAVILNDVGPDIAEEGLGRIFDYLGRAPAARTHAEAAAALERAMAPDFPGLPRQRWQEEAETFYTETPEGLGLRYDARLRDAMLAQAAALAEMEEKPSLWPWFAALDGLPTGVIRGAQSDILSSETYAEMQRRHPAMHAVELPDRGHIPFLDEAPAVALIHAVLKEIT
ncbi:alpha/beta fold hydrolase [Tritonibacter horizontis]|uniref:AB hydrolase superfamily protein YvaM n=1 Tax=Tritonibacter horizontis TaxID=1768241 RepID=A0A132BRQ7_9RHOB|nr:alpha/beta hydrolase [Tritonibacter horizontis]KUP91079.1 AB hydrolase superfamily protein YvaM [Tritonibacter horizontis]